MVTLMTYESSSGTRRRCDGTCHSAKRPECVCICGGHYHGAAGRAGGVDAAVRQTWPEVYQSAESQLRGQDGTLSVGKYIQARMTEVPWRA